MKITIWNFISKTASQPNIKEIINACTYLYIEKLKSGRRKPTPNLMLKALKTICDRFKLPGRTQVKLRARIKRIIFNIRIQSNQKTKMAPIFHPSHLIKLIEQLWYAKNNKNLIILLAKRQSALQAMICLVTGRRWTDIIRIKWETLEIITTAKEKFIKFLIPVSKTNQIGSRIESITLRKSKTKQYLCPVDMILKLKYWVGQPTNGFVFKCLSPKRKWVWDSINPNWSSYRCNGHWINEEKHPCLGHTSSTTSFGYFERYAKRKKWKNIPTKHTFRRTCLLIAKQLGISRKQINEGFGWVPHSDMIRHYTAEQDSTTINAPAVAIANQLDNKNPFECLNDIKFTDPF